MEEITLELNQPIHDVQSNPEIKAPSGTVPDRANMEDSPVKQAEPDLQVIGRIKSSAYGGFTKILATLTAGMSKSDIISIENGQLNSISGGGYLYSDMSMLFGKNNFDIIDPQHSIKLLRLITGGDEVIFVNDRAESKYLISNLVDDIPQITVALAQPDPSTSPKITKPTLGDKVEFMVLEPEVVNTLQTAAKNLESQFFIINIFEKEDGSLEIASVSTDKETFNYDFKSAEHKTTAYKLFNPFPIAKPESLQFELWKNEANELWVKTISAIGIANIEYTEKITPMGDFDTFAL